MGTPAGDARRLCSNEGMFQAFSLVWQTAQNGRLHKTKGPYYQSCMYPTDSAWPAFLMPFLLLSPASGHLSRGFTVPPTKRAYSALHPQALTECSPLEFEDHLLQNKTTEHVRLTFPDTREVYPAKESSFNNNNG